MRSRRVSAWRAPCRRATRPIQRIEQLTGQIDELDQRLIRLVEHHAPQLLVPVGVGPDSAVTLLITMGGGPERLNSQASFAALCGVSPIEYSSGTRRTRRLNHGGDRQANAALHRIVFTRLRFDPRTQATTNAAPRRGKTRREIIRCLKRYAAREVFNPVRTVSSVPRYRGVCLWAPLSGVSVTNVQTVRGEGPAGAEDGRGDGVLNEVSKEGVNTVSPGTRVIAPRS